MGCQSSVSAKGASLTESNISCSGKEVTGVVCDQLIPPTQEWSQSHLKTIAKKSTDTSTVNYDVALEGTDSNKATTTFPREIVTFVDSDGSCYHVSVEGNKIKNMTPSPNYVSVSCDLM